MWFCFTLKFFELGNKFQESALKINYHIFMNMTINSLGPRRMYILISTKTKNNNGFSPNHRHLKDQLLGLHYLFCYSMLLVCNLQYATIIKHVFNIKFNFLIFLQCFLSLTLTFSFCLPNPFFCIFPFNIYIYTF